MFGDYMTYPPIDILNKGFKANKTACENDIMRWFVAGGYGVERAKYWLNQFVSLGLIEKNKDGRFRIAEEYCA